MTALSPDPDLRFPGGDKVVLGCYRLAKKLFKFN